jgi:putative AlgH/UPF0301 family transcriptional regulator
VVHIDIPAQLCRAADQLVAIVAGAEFQPGLVYITRHEQCGAIGP